MCCRYLTYAGGDWRHSTCWWILLACAEQSDCLQRRRISVSSVLHVTCEFLVLDAARSSLVFRLQGRVLQPPLPSAELLISVDSTAVPSCTEIAWPADGSTWQTAC